MNELLAKLVDVGSVLAIGLIPAALTLAVALVLRVLAAFRESLQNSKLGGLTVIFSRLVHFAEVVVADLNATLKPELMAATADGKLTIVETTRIKNLALARVKALLAEEGLKELQKVAGIASSEIDQYLAGVIETVVDRLKPRP